MADAAAVAELRRLIDEPDQTTYTDDQLGARLDAVGGDTMALASTMWREKAARFAGLIDVKEGTSDRKMSQLYQQALRMADSFLPGGTVVVRRPARTRPIERM